MIRFSSGIGKNRQKRQDETFFGGKTTANHENLSCSRNCFMSFRAQSGRIHSLGMAGRCLSYKPERLPLACSVRSLWYKEGLCVCFFLNKLFIVAITFIILLIVVIMAIIVAIPFRTKTNRRKQKYRTAIVISLEWKLSPKERTALSGRWKGKECLVRAERVVVNDIISGGVRGNSVEARDCCELYSHQSGRC